MATFSFRITFALRDITIAIGESFFKRFNLPDWFTGLRLEPVIISTVLPTKPYDETIPTSIYHGTIVDTKGNCYFYSQVAAKVRSPYRPWTKRGALLVYVWELNGYGQFTKVVGRCLAGAPVFTKDKANDLIIKYQESKQ